MPLYRLLCSLLLLIVFHPFPLRAQSESTEKKESKTLQFRSIGPAAGGRVARVAGIPGDPSTYYAAGAASGVWKTVDGGLTWKPIFDDQPISSIGSIAVAPSDPNVIYVGSGEANIRGNVAAGNGIYKSTDAGKSWAHVWKQEGQIGTMIVHPKNPDVAFAAVLGHAFGPNDERGVFRTTDGGKIWKQVLKKNADTGASDVCFDPSNPNVLFAGLWQARRQPWELTTAGPGSGLYVSRNNGETWKQLTGNGLPEGIWGKVCVAVAPSDSRRVYAIIEAEKGGMYRSDDGGENWTYASEYKGIRQRAWYFSTFTVDPTNADIIYCPQVSLLKSIDGGKTYKAVKGPHHGDHHDIWIDPTDPRRLISANDGGVDITTNSGESWYAPMLPIAQFYRVNVNNAVPFAVSGAMQDIGTALVPSNSLSSSGITRDYWYTVGGGEAGHTASDPTDPNIVYAGEYGGYISRYDHRTRQARNVSIYPTNPSGHGAEDLKYRFQWTSPILISPHDPKTIYHASNVIFRTTDGGQSWTPLSSDLTRNDKSKQKWSGGPITGDNTGVEFYCTIFAIAESPKQKDLLWAGSDDGLVHVSRDGGKNWTNVTGKMPGFPEWGTVKCIEASPHDAGTAYVVVEAHRLDNMQPYLYKTSDFGQSWKRLTDKLPQDVYLHAVREDPKRKGTLYVGTERGVVYSTNDGADWKPLRFNLPTVAVCDLAVKDNSLVVGTIGRSLWILDDLTPIREMTDKVTGQDVFLFPTSDVYRWQYHYSNPDKYAGDNPADGAVIFYHLKQKAKELKLEILDEKGTVIRTLSSVPEPKEADEAEYSEGDEDEPKDVLSTEPGLQSVEWDLTHTGAKLIKGAKVDAGTPKVGPTAVPGTYTLRLLVDGKALTTPLVIKPDPRVQLTPAQLVEQLQFALKIRDDVSTLTETVEQLRSLKQQLAARTQLLKDTEKAAELVKAAKALTEKLDALEAKLHNPKAQVTYDILAQKGGAKLYSQLSPLLEWVKDSDGVPTQGMREVYAGLSAELAQYRGEMKSLVETDLAAINKTAKDMDLPYIGVK